MTKPILQYQKPEPPPRWGRSEWMIILIGSAVLTLLTLMLFGVLGG